MSTQCGGIKLDGTTLKTIEGVICEANTLIVDPTKVVTGCGGQEWDGDSFKIVPIGSEHYVTYCPSSEEVIGDVVKYQAGCGLGIDKRFFTRNADGTIGLIGGHLLMVHVTPADAIISVLDSESHAIQPITGTTNQFLCSGTISVTVQKDGYQGKSQTIVMNENKEISVTIYPLVELTVHMVTPPTADTIIVKDADSHTISPKSGTTNVFEVEDTQYYTITTAAEGYNTTITPHTMNGSETVDITMQPI